MESLTYPPEEMLQPPVTEKRNIEHIILWLLYYNDELEWSHFTKEPIDIPQSTFSIWKNKLELKGYIEKVSKEIQGRKRKIYQITAEGKERFFQLSSKKKTGKQLNYPPKVITHRRNYDHWILWMLYNNSSCRWSDFKDDPLSINQSSLSNNLNSLMEKDFIKKENKEYVITSTGKTEYFRTLKLYDLDRQSVLEEESKRIEKITRRTNKFFESHDINDDDIKFRFLNNVLKLDYSKVDAMIDDEEEFNKILLFLSMNHPNRYPEYLTREKFCSEYDFTINTLNFFIEKIVYQDPPLYDTKFFKLEVFPDKEYYFQEGEKLEHMLRAIIDEKIAKFTYLNKLNGKTSEKVSSLNINTIIGEVLNELCTNLFHDNLKEPLRKFLQDYIKYLAYQIETEKFGDSSSKLENLVWQIISDEFQSFSPPEKQLIEGREYAYTLNPKIFETLDLYYLTKLDFMNMNAFKEKFNPSNQEFLREMETFLNGGKKAKAKKLLEDNDNKLNDIERLILQDIISTQYYKFEESLELTKNLIQKAPGDYLGYLFQSITYFLIGDFKKALETVEESLDETYNIALICQKAEILLKLDKKDDALKIIEEALSSNPEDNYLLRTKFLTFLSVKGICMYTEYCKAPLDLIDIIIKFNPKDKESLILKAVILCIARRYKEAKKIIREEIEIDIFNKIPRVDTAALFILVYSYLARGKFEKAINTADKIQMLYPNHYISFLSKALIHGYNLIYNFDSQEQNLDFFLELIERTVSLDPLKHHQARYYQFKGIILLEIKQLNEALSALDKAIELIPQQNELIFNKIYFLLTNEREREALAIIDEQIKKDPTNKLDLNKTKSFIYFQTKDYEEGLKAVDEIISLNPQDKVALNNKALMLAKLNRTEEALEVGKQLINLDPNDGNLHDSYGEVLMIFEEYEEAIKEFEKAIEIEPTGWFIAESYKKMSKSYEKLGDLEKAREFNEKSKMIADKNLPTGRKLYNKD